MINYNLEQATLSARETETPVKRFEWAEGIEDFAKVTSQLLGSAEKGYEQEKKRIETEDKKKQEILRQNQYQSEMESFVSEADRVHMTQSEMRVGAQEIFESYPDLKYSDKYSINEKVGYKNITPVASRVAEAEAEAESNRIVEENKKVREVGTAYVGALRAANMSDDDLLDIGERVLAGQQLIEYAGVVDNDPKIPNNIKSVYLDVAAQEITNSVNIEASNALAAGERITKPWINTKREQIISQLVREKEYLPASAKYVADKAVSIWQPYADQTDLTMEDLKKLSEQALAISGNVLNLATEASTGITPEYKEFFMTPGLIPDETRRELIKNASAYVSNTEANKALIYALGGNLLNADGTPNLAMLGKNISLVQQGIPLTDGQQANIDNAAVLANNANVGSMLKTPGAISDKALENSRYNLEWIRDNIRKNPAAINKAAKGNPEDAAAIKYNYSSGIAGSVVGHLLDLQSKAKGMVRYTNGEFYSTDAADDGLVAPINGLLMTARYTDQQTGGVLLDEDLLRNTFDAAIHTFGLNKSNTEKPLEGTTTEIFKAGKGGDTERQLYLMGEGRKEDEEVFLNILSGALMGAPGFAFGPVAGITSVGLGAFSGAYGSSETFRDYVQNPSKILDKAGELSLSLVRGTAGKVGDIVEGAVEATRDAGSRKLTPEDFGINSVTSQEATKEATKEATQVTEDRFKKILDELPKVSRASETETSKVDEEEKVDRNYSELVEKYLPQQAKVSQRTFNEAPEKRGETQADIDLEDAVNDLFVNLKKEEGFVKETDKVNPLDGTITTGYGFNLSDARKSTNKEFRKKVEEAVPGLLEGNVKEINQQQADALLLISLNAAIERAKAFIGTNTFNSLSKERKRALIDMAFNTKAFEDFKKMKEALQNENFEAAADEIIDSRRGRGEVRTVDPRSGVERVEIFPGLILRSIKNANDIAGKERYVYDAINRRAVKKN